MEPYKYEIDTEIHPVDLKGRMFGVAKSVAGIYAFNKLRKISSKPKVDLTEPQPEEQPIEYVDQYVFYESGMMLLEESFIELYTLYLEHCDNPDTDVIDRALYVYSMINYAKGVSEEDATQA